MAKNEGVDLPNGKAIKALEKNDGYKYLGILERDKVRSDKMKGNEYLRRMKRILKCKLNSGDVVKTINSRTVSIIRYGAGIIEWTKEKLKEVAFFDWTI